MTRGRSGGSVLKRVLHTGVEVADLQKSIAFYERLGFHAARTFDKPEPKAKVAMMQQRERDSI